LSHLDEDQSSRRGLSRKEKAGGEELAKSNHYC